MTEVFGDGAQRAWLFRPDGEPRAVLLFLHGSGELDPTPMAAWIGHLRRIGAAVVYPQYQSHPDAPGATLLDDLAAGLRAALDALGRPELPFGTIGFSRGAHLAVHQAARARTTACRWPGRSWRSSRAGCTATRRPTCSGCRPTWTSRSWSATVTRSSGAGWPTTPCPRLSHHPQQRLRIVEVVSAPGLRGRPRGADA